MRWTKEATDQLKVLWKQGQTDQEIAKRLRVSSDAVLGRRHRLKLYRDAPAKVGNGKPKDKLFAWNEPDPNNPDHAQDERDFKILDAMVAGGTAAAVARHFKLPTSYVVELWRVRQLQEPVGEEA